MHYLPATRAQRTHHPAIVVRMVRTPQRRLQRDESMPPVELERRAHLIHRLQVTAHEQELPRRLEALLEQRVTNTLPARIHTQVHALQFAGEWIRARERCDARSAHDLPV